MVVTRANPDRRSATGPEPDTLVEKPASEAMPSTTTSRWRAAAEPRTVHVIGYRGMHSFDLSRSCERQDCLIRMSSAKPASLGRELHFTMTGAFIGRPRTDRRALLRRDVGRTAKTQP